MSQDDLEAIYRELQQGTGREKVDDTNVDALIEIARSRGDLPLEYLRREWRSPCGEDADAPELRPPGSRTAH